jgi:outer membrane protein assembly factor BamB
MKWEFRRPVRSAEANIGGLLSTAGDLVFGSDLADIFALRASDGAMLWTFDAGAKVDAAPVSYRSGGKQMLAVAAGQILIAFALHDDEPRAGAQTHAAAGKTAPSSAANRGP